MRKEQIKNAKDNEIIVDYVISHALLVRNENLRAGTKRLSQHCMDLEQELVKRELLTKEDVNIINS